MNIATLPRNIFQIQRRILIHAFYRVLQEIYKRIFKFRSIHGISIYPAVQDLQTLGNLVNRIAWYLPNLDKPVDILCTCKLLEEIKEDDIPVPKNQDRHFQKIPQNIRLVKEKDWKHDKDSFVLLWKWKLLLKFFMSLHRVAVIDPDYFSIVESTSWADIYHRVQSEKDLDVLRHQSVENYDQLIDKVRSFQKAYIFATGPSLDKASQLKYEDNSFKIICNSVVKNAQLLEYINPQLLVFADPVFHFSPCLYDAEFRKAMLQTVEKYHCYCMVPDLRLGMMAAHYPQLRDRLIGMPVKAIRTWNFPTKENFYVKQTGNIMTMMMMPLASVVSKKVYIIGADGRQKGEKYFWRHAQQSQYHDLMQTAIETHPSFFRDRIYDDYYIKHCRVIESQIRFGEDKGISYYSLTPSYIPVLADRLVKKQND